MTSALFEALRLVGPGRDLTETETASAVAAVMAGDATDAAIAAFLTALHVKGESAAELIGAARAVRAQMAAWDPAGLPTPLLDTCGTGGDGSNTVNISTAAAIVVAACGVPVAKHGNRSATGNSGSAEVLGELGIHIDAEPAVSRRCLAELGIAFLFAPRYHPALRFAAAARKQLPFRTLFNLLGPLANPARPDYQLVGVPGDRQARLVADALAALGCRRAAIVTGGDGLDEVSLDAPTRVLWVEPGAVREDRWEPGDFGLPRVHAAELRVSGPTESAATLRRLFAGEDGPARASVLANSAAALLVAGACASLTSGVARASQAVDDGSAARLVERWRQVSSSSL